MGEITQWSNLAETGYQASTPTPDGAPENHSASSYNNTMRETMAAVRRQWEDKEWFDYGDPPTFLSTTQFTIADTYLQYYAVGRRVRVVDGGAFQYGIVTAVSGSGTLTITVKMDDDFPLTAALTSVAFGVDPLAAPFEQFQLGDQILMPDGSPGEPSYSFQSAPDTGWYYAVDGSLRASVDGADVMKVGVTASRTYLPWRIADGDLANPGLAFSDDLDLGIYRSSNDVMVLASGGANKLVVSSVDIRTTVPFELADGTVSDPALRWASDTDSGWFRDAKGQWFTTNGEQTFGVPDARPWIFQIWGAGNTSLNQWAGIYLGIEEDDASALGGLWFSNRRGDGTDADPNGGFIAGRDIPGTGWDGSRALRWCQHRGAWYIGDVDYTPGGTTGGPLDILQRQEIQAMVDQAIADHLAAEH